MSIPTPLTLLRLAGRSLLRDQASAIAALEYLPAELFPQFFTQAYCRRIPEPLKAVVHAWPFAVLPLGCLSHLSLDEVFKAVLDGLDVLLAQEVRPRRWKLRVLDLRNTGANFWRMWCEDSTQKCSRTGPVAVHSSSPNMEHPLAPLEMFLDLNFNERDRDKFFMYIIQWARQRKGLAHLCCKSLRFFDVPFERARMVLDAVQLDCSRRQLKSLHLFGLRLADFSLESLLALLEAVAPTLEDLGLDHCGMADSHVEAILPVLSRCRQLREFTMSENNFSVATVEKLLRHTAGLHSLEIELYPVPLECYRTQGTVNQERLALIQAELTGTLRELGQPRSILLATKHCSEFYDVAFS
ncbi:PREDICTED: PRAME family member 9/15-like [Myotis davidii]|uniref:PRAME family member 9/15-like n=1 Tax=Myotis davidii TaxID=225400 RepID=UPI00076752DE|nr:PREDICTED: PRAME family member 9/15-like [Myotis davidii]